MADINDRLERLSRREELARRAHQPPPTGVPAEGLGEDFLDVLAAVARAVRRHPGLSVMVAVVDGRPGRSVVRVTERDGTVETALVATPAAPARAAEPGRHARPAAPPPATPAAAPTAAAIPTTAAVPAVPGVPAVPAAAAVAGVPAVPAVPTVPGVPGVAAVPGLPVVPAAAAVPGVPYHRPIADRQPYSRRGAGRPLRAVGEGRPGPSGHSDDPAEDGSTGLSAAERQPGIGPSGLVTLPADTSQVVARLAQLLRDDPSLASGWVRDR